jgi:hypothetical protein
MKPDTGATLAEWSLIIGSIIICVWLVTNELI